MSQAADSVVEYEMLDHAPGDGAEGPKFGAKTVQTLARRAANICSNPDCRRTTTGPAEEPTKAINIGEAAHIFGANPGSKRFRLEMSGRARSEITNAI